MLWKFQNALYLLYLPVEECRAQSRQKAELHEELQAKQMMWLNCRSLQLLTLANWLMETSIIELAQSTLSILLKSLGFDLWKIICVEESMNILTLLLWGFNFGGSFGYTRRMFTWLCLPWWDMDFPKWLIYTIMAGLRCSKCSNHQN